ncbi:hypothetical protein MTIM_32130 [Mycobacterium timonense]|uniref:Uncharacterized protein n=1 Tax=Mycobacterium timonense TaxID=701043 RepID=A0A7I9Z8N7_9MYCO|nr:hypothetical protein MTIM_32130 [Mycobacterium timonense]
MTCVAREPTAHSISNTDASKTGEATISTRASAPSPNAARCAAATPNRPACVTATPLGVPVEPDVKITYAALSTPSGAGRSASVMRSALRPDRSTSSTRSTGRAPAPATSPLPQANTHTAATASSTVATRSAGWA